MATKPFVRNQVPNTPGIGDSFLRTLNDKEYKELVVEAEDFKGRRRPTPEELERDSRSRIAMIRLLVAVDLDTAPHILRRLSRDRDSEVRREAKLTLKYKPAA